MKSAPSADAINIAETLDLLDQQFAAVAAAVERRGFALWVGSGISLGKAPDIGEMLVCLLEHLRQRVDLKDTTCRFRQALAEALEKSGLTSARRVGIQLDIPVTDWPERDEIVHGLWERYASVLDIRVTGEADDYMLWEAVDVRETYGRIQDPDCEHLCIAILIMEGAIADIASANWDGLIEAAVNRLSEGARLLQVVVDPVHLRDQPARTRLIKFHGCAVHCVHDPGTYRHYLIATRPQITDWPHNEKLAGLRNELRGVATRSRALMVGLSLQDTNLQDLFAAAKQALPWSWPCAPEPQGHVFCESTLGEHQINMLRVVYRANYDTYRAEIETSALLPAYAKQVLLALVLHLLAEKLSSLTISACASSPLAATVGQLSAGIKYIRDRVAALAGADCLAFVREFVRLWSRGMALFRGGELLPSGSDRYEPITPLPIQEMMIDPNIRDSGLPESAVALALLGRGEADGKWTLSSPASLNIEHGALQATGTWRGATPTQIYFANNAAVALELIQRGATTSDNIIVLHSDDAWERMNRGPTSRRSPRRAPGRTGRQPVRHVSIRRLLRSASDLATLEQRFEEEVTI